MIASFMPKHIDALTTCLHFLFSLEDIIDFGTEPDGYPLKPIRMG
jgi:hypothetical protein